ncbi:hypothetical protein [Roseibacillus persicicus]|uniref:Uncharacterized protein n=1 Tax=Roseibacillus persicicus TaxID=454148 RepID=A0A918TCR5_9BACT|nr:hypothetical protein [Roseibacillus persicicus]GHC43505.1 hypothetical protein GCM10007100_05820 [Roseibacillus persicicus]
MDKIEDTSTNNPLDQKFLIEFTRLDLGQVIEGLSCRQEEWQQTADWHSGKVSEFPAHLKEGSNAQEAQWVADNYARILSLIERQYHAQS